MHLFFKSALIVALLGALPVMAQPASDATIREVLTVTKSEQLVQGIRGQVKAQLDGIVQKTIKETAPNAKQMQALNAMNEKMLAVLDEELAWSKREPVYVKMYRETFTEEEMLGMLAFYKTPAGQAMINKMPVLMQQVMGSMQTTLADMRPKIEKIQKDFFAEIDAASK